MKAGVLDKLRVYGDFPFPDPQRLVIGCRHEATVSIEERDRVHGSQVTIVVLGQSSEIVHSYLHNLSRSRVPLKDLLVLHSRQEEVLLVVIRVELHTEGDVSCVEAHFHLQTFLKWPTTHTCPVSVSQSFTYRSYDADRNSVPSLLKLMSRTPSR